MDCPVCGTKHTEEALTCQNCGAKLQQAEVARDLEQTVAPTPAQEAQAPVLDTPAEGTPADQEEQHPPATNAPSSPSQAPSTPATPPLKRKTSPLARVLVAVAVLVLIAAGLVMLAVRLNDPRHIVKAYFDSVMTHNWDRAYAYTALPDSLFTSKEAYWAFMSLKYPDQTEPYTIQDIRPAGDGQQYTVSYTIGASQNTREFPIALTGPQTKWVVFKTYRVDLEPMLCQNMAIQVPVNAKVAIDAIPLPENLKAETSSHMDVYRIPIMFKGRHTIQIQTDFAADYETNLTTEDNDTYTAKKFTLQQATLQALLNKAGEALNAFYQNASQGKHFDDVQGYFAADRQQSIRQSYETLRENIQFLNGVGVTDVALSNFQVVSDSDYAGTYHFEDNQLVLKVSCQATYTLHYLDDWRPGIAAQSPSTPETMVREVAFAYQNGQWVITALD